MKNAGYIVFVLFLFSCGSGGNSGQGKESGISALPVLDMEYAYEHVDEADTSFVWNDLIENERFIPLETKENSDPQKLPEPPGLIHYLISQDKHPALYSKAGRMSPENLRLRKP